MEPSMSTTGNTSKNVLNSDVEIKGNLKFSGELTFDGKLDGEIHTDGILNLGDSAVINGNINAQSVVVRGKINGNINFQYSKCGLTQALNGTSAVAVSRSRAWSQLY